MADVMLANIFDRFNTGAKNPPLHETAAECLSGKWAVCSALSCSALMNAARRGAISRACHWAVKYKRQHPRGCIAAGGGQRKVIL